MHARSRRRTLRSRRRGRSPTEVHNQRLAASVALRALDQLCAGVIITDNQGQVMEMNQAAKSIVQLEDGLIIRDGQLGARRAFENTRVVKLVADATGRGQSRAAAGRMLIGRYDGLPAYVLSVAPLRADLALNDRRFAMIVIVDPERHSPSAKDLAQFFGLSPAEARLAVALLTGKTLAEIARNSGIQVTTLKTQLRCVLKKVGAKRQSDLIRILSSIGIGSVSLAAGWLDVALEALQLPLSLGTI